MFIMLKKANIDMKGTKSTDSNSANEDKFEKSSLLHD